MTERRVTALIESASRAPDGATLLGEASERLREIMPFDGSAWFGTDPGTLMITPPAHLENVQLGDCGAFWEREYRVEDAMLFRDLVHTGAGAGTLLNVTANKPSRSTRYREFLAPQGYGDELRAAFQVGGSTWGMLDLFRDRSRPPFSDRELAIVRAIAAPIARALRAFARKGKIGPARATIDGPGTALFDDDALVSLDENAERLFAEIGGPNWASAPPPMSAVFGIVARARAIHAGADAGPARARLRAASGRWLTIHGSHLTQLDGRSGPIAVTVEAAKSAHIAPIIVEAYSLTPREQEITRLVAQGLSTPEIAAELFLSQHTVRDHLKAAFAKVGVTTRGELVARLFAEHYGPALHAPDADVTTVTF